MDVWVGTVDPLVITITSEKKIFNVLYKKSIRNQQNRKLPKLLQKIYEGNFTPLDVRMTYVSIVNHVVKREKCGWISDLHVHVM